MEMSNRSYGPWLAGDTAGGRLQQATKEGEAQREGVKGEGGAGGNNLESSFPTLTAKSRHRAPDKVIVVDTECEGERGHGLLYRPGSSVNSISLPEVRKWSAIFGQYLAVW